MCSHLIQNLGFVAGCKEKMIWSIYIRTKIPQKCALDGELGRTSALYLNICPIHSNQLITTEGLLLWPTDCDASSQQPISAQLAQMQVCPATVWEPAHFTQQPILMRRHSAGCIHVSTDGDLTKLGDGDPVPALQLLVARLDGEMLPAEGCTLWPQPVRTRGQEE